MLKHSSNIRMLKLRGDLHYLNVPLADIFSKKIVTYCDTSMWIEFEVVAGFCSTLAVFKTLKT